AHMAKVSTRTVTNRLRALGYSLIKCGELHKNAVYSDCIVEIINQLRDEQGLTFREIAQRLSHELQPNPTPALARHLYWRRTAADAVLRELLPD
ncbi:DNA-binding protein, partial [Escherichia coli]